MAQNPPAAESGQTIRTSATEVLLDLVVRDKRGKPVKNLTPADVEIYEDGVRQQVLSLRLTGGRQAQKQKKGAPAAAVEARPLAAVTPVCIVFHNLDPVRRSRGLEAVQDFLKQDFSPETYFATFVLDDRLKPVLPFTADRNEVVQSLATTFSGRTVGFDVASAALLTANPNRITIQTMVDYAAHTGSGDITMSGGEVSPGVNAGADVGTGPGANAYRGDQVYQQNQFGHISGKRSLDQLKTLIGQLGTLPGRKLVLFVSGGLLTDGDPDHFQAVVNSANQAGLTFYFVDSQGLDDNSTSQAGTMAIGQVAGTSRTQADTTAGLEAARARSQQGDVMESAVRASDTQAPLRALSERTGGFMIANTNNYSKPFGRIAQDLDTHYEASYRPTSNKFDGRLRKIEVKLAKPEWQVESRTGYFAVPEFKGGAPLTAYETTALAVLSLQPPPHAFDFHAKALRFGHDGAAVEDALAIELPGGALAATPQAGGQTDKVHVSILSLVKDGSGLIVDRFSVDAPATIPHANLAAVKSGTLTYTYPFRLGPGRYSVETVVMDREGGRVSTSVVPFENPELRKGVALSTVTLVQRLEPANGPADASDPLIYQGKRVVPMLGSAFSAAAKPYLYFVVYPEKGNAEKPKLLVEFLQGGKLVARQHAQLPAPDATGKIPMLVAAVVRPGDCELRITAIQGSGQATDQVRYTVAQ